MEVTNHGASRLNEWTWSKMLQFSLLARRDSTAENVEGKFTMIRSLTTRKASTSSRCILTTGNYCTQNTVSPPCQGWRCQTIGHYAEDGGPGEVWFLCSFYHEPLRSWIKTNVNKFVILSHTALKLGTQSLRSCLKVTCEYELHILLNTLVVPQKIIMDHGENYLKVRPPLVRHLLRNRLLGKLNNSIAY